MEAMYRNQTYDMELRQNERSESERGEEGGCWRSEVVYSKGTKYSFEKTPKSAKMNV